jgi:hypothetical protein
MIKKKIMSYKDTTSDENNRKMHNDLYDIYNNMSES